MAYDPVSDGQDFFMLTVGFDWLVHSYPDDVDTEQNKIYAVPSTGNGVFGQSTSGSN